MFSGVRSISNRMRIGFALLLVMVLGLAAPLSASALIIGRAPNIVSAIALSPRSPNFMLINQQITISFHYNTTSVSGIVVTAAPFTGAAMSANATTCKTAVLPVGAGTSSCTIGVTAGPVSVTGIRFQIWDSTQKTLLFQTNVPVNYQFANPTNFMSSIGLTPAAPNDVVLGKGVSVKFSYKTTQAGGVSIIAVPYTGTAVTANASTCGSTIYPVGSGTGTCRFSVSTVAANVTSVHLQMWDTGHTTMITQAVLPVMYHFRSGTTLLVPASVSQSPNIFRLGNKVYVHFSYQTTEAGGIIVVATPFTGTTATANATLGQSVLLPVGTGKGSCTFLISNGAATVNSVRIQAWDSTQTKVLFVVGMPVNYQFK